MLPGTVKRLLQKGQLDAIVVKSKGNEKEGWQWGPCVGSGGGRVFFTCSSRGGTTNSELGLEGLRTM